MCLAPALSMNAMPPKPSAWSDRHSMTTRRVQVAIAVHPNEAGDLVIRQQAHYLVDREDLVIVIGAEHIEAFIEQVHLIAGIPTKSSRRPLVGRRPATRNTSGVRLDRSRHSVPASAQAAGYADHNIAGTIAIITSRRDRRSAQAQTARARNAASTGATDTA